MRIRLVLSFCCLAIAPVCAGSWAPIPPEVWAMKEDPAKGIKGAVILERKMSFRNTQVEYLVRIRILSESGRRAADLAEFGEEAHSFEGRTIYPDGRVIPFNNRKDFTKGTAVSVGNSDIKRTIMIPPGVTSNCLVEVRWKESADVQHNSPLPSRLGYDGEWALGDAYPTELSVVEIPTRFPYGFTLFPGPLHTPEAREQWGYRIFAFRNLPAFEEAPYSFQVTRPIPRLSIYFQPPRLGGYTHGTPQIYWDAAARIFLQSWFEDEVQKGRTFMGFAKELTTGLVGSPHSQAQGILRSLEARIKNRRHLTFEEAKQTAKVKKHPGDEDLDAVIEAGSASSYGMRILFYQLLKAAGLRPKIAMVADRDIRLVNPNARNFFQFTHYLIGVDEPGRPTLWLDPTKRFAPPGMVHPDFQGTQAAIVDPAKWTVTWESIPPQPSGMNVREYRYQMDMDESEDRFTFDTRFDGFPEYAERYRFLSLEGKEQERLLREELEGYMKQTTFTKTQVLNAQDSLHPFGWHVEGKIEREEGRRREVYPFPGMQVPLYQPDAWPDQRTDTIVIPYLRTHRAVSRIRVLKGFLIPQIEPIQEQNEFGSVSWTLTPLEQPGELEINLVVVASGFAAKAEGYQAFRTFMGWVSTATNRTLILGRER
ncbi:MAG: hypothetical protein Q8K67_05060 [Geothrix sp.]|nr:hypothetical protein [Geothrix sp.]